MRFSVLGSGSRGNAMVLEAGGQALLVDAGFGVRTLLRRLAAVGIAPDALIGIVLTHEHGDHARGARKFAHQHALPVIASTGTLHALFRQRPAIATAALYPPQGAAVGPFVISSCPTTHDAAEPLALAIECTHTGRKIGIANDLGRVTPGVRALLRRCHALIVEANHDDALLQSGPYPPSVRRRIAGAGGHLSNRAAASLTADLCHADLQIVVLTHLSEACNRPALARTAVQEALVARQFRGRIVVARQGEPLAPHDLAPATHQLTLGLPP